MSHSYENAERDDRIVEVIKIVDGILEHLPGWSIDEALTYREIDYPKNKVVLVREEDGLMVSVAAFFWDNEEAAGKKDKRRLQGCGLVPDEDFGVARSYTVKSGWITMRANREPHILARDINRRLIIPHEANFETGVARHADIVQHRREQEALIRDIAEALGLPVPGRETDEEKRQFLLGRVGNDWLSTSYIQEGNVKIEAILQGDHQLILASLTALREVLDIRSVSQALKPKHYVPWEFTASKRAAA